MQDPAFRSTAGSRVIQALQQAEYTLRAERLAAAEQTRVEFFTLAREAGA
jgi:alpha-D-ribose 1-methylphosphonate 5-triphosphate synthase subunit PhnG